MNDATSSLTRAAREHRAWRCRSGCAAAPSWRPGRRGSRTAVLPGEQVFFEDRSHHQQHRHLRYPIPDSRNSQRALPTSCLGHPYTQQGPAPILLGAQLLPQSLQPARQPGGLDGFEALAVYPGGAAIGTASPVGFKQDIFSAHLVPQAVETCGCFALGFRL